jgi:hypothetical protein
MGDPNVILCIQTNYVLKPLCLQILKVTLITKLPIPHQGPVAQHRQHFPQHPPMLQISRVASLVDGTGGITDAVERYPPAPIQSAQCHASDNFVRK